MEKNWGDTPSATLICMEYREFIYPSCIKLVCKMHDLPLRRI